MPFINNKFLLHSDIAEQLYHNYAKDLPIIDYHNHLDPKKISENYQFKTITELWLSEDHYKWRALRAAGVSEEYITGNKTDEEKFEKWILTIPKTIRNPLYHWSHLEMKRYFDWDNTILADDSANLYQHCNEKLADNSHYTLGLLEQQNVQVVCTTDDPIDDLEHHQAHNSELKLLPGFRPDNVFAINTAGFLGYINKLAVAASTSIKTFENLKEALINRIDHFHMNGCRLSDHGLPQLPFVEIDEKKAEAAFNKALNNQSLSKEEADVYLITVLNFLGLEYGKRAWTMQLHLGPLRNNNSRLKQLIGSDAGCDSIGDLEQAQGLSKFLNQLDKSNRLPKTILYNLNPRDNELFATMAGNFNDGSVAGKVQWGAAWWFLDQKDGITNHINCLSNLGLISSFVGMLTDSRSFLSFPRHEYFRRIFCNILATDINNGYLPNDMNLIGEVVKDVCYRNAINYFNFE